VKPAVFARSRFLLARVAAHRLLYCRCAARKAEDGYPTWLRSTGKGQGQLPRLILPLVDEPPVTRFPPASRRSVTPLTSIHLHSPNHILAQYPFTSPSPAARLADHSLNAASNDTSDRAAAVGFDVVVDYSAPHRGNLRKFP